MVVEPAPGGVGGMEREHNLRQHRRKWVFSSVQAAGWISDTDGNHTAEVCVSGSEDRRVMGTALYQQEAAWSRSVNQVHVVCRLTSTH